MLQPRSTLTLPLRQCRKLHADPQFLGQLRQGPQTMHSSFQRPAVLTSFAGSIPSRPRPSGDHHHRQLPDVVHLPPSARRPHQQLVLGRARQRTPRPDPRPRRPRRLASPRCQPGARRGIMTLSPATLKREAATAAFGNLGHPNHPYHFFKRRLHKPSPFNSSLVLDWRVRHTLVIRILIISYPPPSDCPRHVVKKKLGASLYHSFEHSPAFHSPSASERSFFVFLSCLPSHGIFGSAGFRSSTGEKMQAFVSFDVRVHSAAGSVIFVSCLVTHFREFGMLK